MYAGVSALDLIGRLKDAGDPIGVATFLRLEAGLVAPGPGTGRLCDTLAQSLRLTRAQHHALLVQASYDILCAEFEVEPFVRQMLGL
jgi:hypothetical protein